MKEHRWERVDGFRSTVQFERFLLGVAEQLRLGCATQEVVRSPYQGIEAFQEAWYREHASGICWRLVWPDPPFAGLFEPVHLGFAP